MFMNDLSATLAALADPTRRAIIARLANGEATVSQLVERFDLTQPTISSHLKVLEKAGLVSRDRIAQTRPCRLNPAGLKTVADWLNDYQRFWMGALDRFVERAERQSSESEKDGKDD